MAYKSLMGTLDDAVRDRLRRLMLDHGVTQKQLAEAAGWKYQASASKYLLRQIKAAGLDELRGMAALFGYSLTEIIGETAPLPTDATQFIGRFNALPPAAREALLAMMASFPKENRAMGEARQSYRLPPTPESTPARTGPARDNGGPSTRRRTRPRSTRPK